MKQDDARAIKALSKGTGWSARAGTLSQRSATNALHVFEFAGWLQFRVKPLIWDEIFWQIMGAEFSRKPSPSRHHWGQNCPVPSIAATELAGNTPQDRAIIALRFADASAATFKTACLSLGDMLKKAALPARATDYVETEVVAHLAAGKVSAAHGICADVLSKKRVASFSNYVVLNGTSYSFFDRALTWTPDPA